MEPKDKLQQHVGTLAALAPLAGKGKKGLPMQQLAHALLRLQRGLTGGRPLAGGPYMEDDALLSAYLLYYWPVSYQQMRHICRQLPAEAVRAAMGAGKAGPSILDIGSGPGPAAAALCDFLLSSPGRPLPPGRALSVCFADHSAKSLSLAQRIFARDFPSVATRAVQSPVEQGLPQLHRLAGGKKFSAVLLCHALNELWPGEDRRAEKRAALIARVLDDCMEENALLLLCEPAQTQSSRDLMAVRDSLLSLRGDIRLLSPCPKAAVPCPALLGGATCHAEEGWDPVEPARSLAEAAGLDRRSVKMAYFAFQKRSEGQPQARPAQTQKDAGAFTARVVSDALLNKAGRTRFVLCDGTRRFSLSAKKGDPLAEEKGFWSLRRGLLLQVSGAQARGGGEAASYALAESTEIFQKINGDFPENQQQSSGKPTAIRRGGSS